MSCQAKTLTPFSLTCQVGLVVELWPHMPEVRGSTFSIGGFFFLILKNSSANCQKHQLGDMAITGHKMSHSTRVNTSIGWGLVDDITFTFNKNYSVTTHVTENLLNMAGITIILSPALGYVVFDVIIS